MAVYREELHVDRRNTCPCEWLSNNMWDRGAFVCRSRREIATNPEFFYVIRDKSWFFSLSAANRNFFRFPRYIAIMLA